MPTLLVKHPEKGEMTFSLSGARVTIGRRADNSIQINHGTVSGHHAELLSTNGHYVLRDLGSTNHSFVEGLQITEKDLKARCRVQIGTIECEFLPDEIGEKSAAHLADASNLRKTIGHLREQNEELITKLNEQQKQIDILGSARLLTPATGANMNTLRAEVKLITVERDKLVSENKTLHAEILRLRGLVAIGGDSGSFKNTVAVRLPGDDDAKTPIVITSGGAVLIPAPIARAVTSEEVALRQITELHPKLRAICIGLASQPDQKEPQLALASLCGQMLTHALVLNNHPVGRLVTSLDALARDIAARIGALDPSLLRTTTQAVELLNIMLTPENLSRCKTMPALRILAVDDDKDLLNALQAALEFSHLATTGVATAGVAIELLKKESFDLVLLDILLPDMDGLEACSRIREISEHAKTPIVFVSSHDTIANRERGAANGGNDFIGKPFNMFELTLKAYHWAYRHQFAH